MYVDGTDIYLSKLDVQGGYFWIDAINTDHALVVRSTSNDDVVAEVVSAEQDAMMLDEGYYYFDQSEANLCDGQSCPSRTGLCFA